MRLIFSGKTKEFTPDLEEKISAKLSKLSKFVEQRGEREAHLTHQVERHIHKVEIVMNIYDHSVVGEAAETDLTAAACGALENFEKRLLKLRARWRDTRRDPKAIRSNKESWESPTEAATAEDLKTSGAKNAKKNGSSPIRGNPHVFRVNYNDGRKPMTVEEAMLEMRGSVPYIVYRDSDRDCVSVLVRRGDGNFDLIES